MPVADKLNNDTRSNYANLQRKADLQPEIILLGAPPSVQDRYKRIKARWEMARARSGQHQAEVESSRQQKDSYAAKLYAAEESHKRFGKQAPKAEVEKLKAQIKFFKDKCSAVAPSDIQLPKLNDLDVFIRNYSCEFVAADVDFIDNATPEMLAEAEASSKALRKSLGVVENAPRPKAVCEAAVIAELDMLEGRGKPKLDSIQFPVDVSERTGRFEIARGGDFVEWPRRNFRIGDPDNFQTFDALAFLVWSDRDAIQNKLIAEIRARKNEGLSVEDKVMKVADLHAQIVTAMRREDAILLALESQGGFKFRKKHFHPAITLGIEFSDASRIAEYTP
jgi:hypothetical protein